MPGTRRILRIGAWGAGAAAVALLALFVVGLSLGEDFSVLEGATTPADFAAAVDRHAAAMKTAMAIDNLFVIGYSLALLGIAAWVRRQTPLLGNVALGASLLAAFLDYAENSLTVALIQNHLLGVAPSGNWLLGLHVIGQVKFLVAFAAVALLALGLWSLRPLDRVMSVLGLFFPPVGVLGLVVSSLAPLIVLWMLALLVCGGLLLWRRAAEV